MNDTITPLTIDQLTENQRNVMLSALDNGVITTQYAVADVGVMKPLVNAGWFVREFTERRGYYRYKLTSDGYKAARDLMWQDDMGLHIYTSEQCPKAYALAHSAYMAFEDWQYDLDNALKPISAIKLDSLGIDAKAFQGATDNTIIALEWGTVIVYTSVSGTLCGKVSQLL